MNDQERQRALDKCMSKVFIGNNSAFLGSVMCALDFVWDSTIPTAATNGLKLWWNPEWFDSMCEDSRVTVLLHELWHPASLHMLRMGPRDPKIWNYACDIRINNDLENEGRSFKGIEDCWKDHSYDATEKAAEEDIYDKLIKQAKKVPQTGSFGDSGGSGDMTPDPDAKKADGDEDGGGSAGGPGGTQPHPSTIPLTPAEQARVVAQVVAAKQAANLAKQAGSVPGCVEEFIKDFLDPVIPWEQQLMKFFTDLSEEDYSWARPNRRYSDIYLPTMLQDESRLEHLHFYFDVSGSVTDEQARRFGAEVKYIQEVIRPQKLTLIQFDTKIQHSRDYLEDEEFTGLTIHGRGGTSLTCVHKHIEEHKPTAAIIFSDLYCSKMAKLPSEIPIVWVCIGNQQATVDFGELIHIKE